MRGILIIYFVGINLMTFLLYGVDKWKARHLKFILGVPAIILLQALLVFWLLRR